MLEDMQLIEAEGWPFPTKLVSCSNLREQEYGYKAIGYPLFIMSHGP